MRFPSLALAASILLSSSAMAAPEITPNIDNLLAPTAEQIIAHDIEVTSIVHGEDGIDISITPPEFEITQSDPETPTEAPRAAFSARGSDAACIALAVFHEAKSEPLRGQAAVAHAILNRTKSGHYPSTPCGVVYQRVAGHPQFHFLSKANLAPTPREQSMWNTAMAIARRVLAGEPDPINGATSFFNPRFGSAGMMRAAVYTVQIGHHVFIRLR